MAAAKKSPAKKAGSKLTAKKTMTKPAKKAASKPSVKKAPAKKPVVKAKPAARKPVKSTPPKAAAGVAKSAAHARASVAVAAPPRKAAAPTIRKAETPRPARHPGTVSSQSSAVAVAPVATASPVIAAPKPAPAPTPRDLAAAHEYLLARSATRSEAPVMVNGKRLLTEGELLKMADTDYMNEAQLAFFKHRLQQMERELLQNADETTEHLRETVIVPDPADRATIEEEHALELRTRDRERKLLKKVQQALARIETGDYGYCEETGDPIGIPRLLARPTATLSLEAQQRREMKQKMYGD
jgi:DnaK suppressor protein